MAEYSEWLFSKIALLRFGEHGAHAAFKGSTLGSPSLKRSAHTQLPISLQHKFNKR